jgi:AcrR family transcriptional regulator
MRERAREAAAAALLEAAEEVVAERGLEATSIAAIAERAGVAVGTLYNYFPDRDALLAALFDLRRSEILPGLEAAAQAARGLPTERALRAYLGEVAAVLESQRRFCRVALATEGSPARRAGKRPALLVAMTTALAELLRPAERDGADDLARMMMGAFKALVQARIQDGQPLQPAADRLVDTFLHGIGRR